MHCLRNMYGSITLLNYDWLRLHTNVIELTWEHMHSYKFLKKKVLGSTLLNIHRFNIVTRPGNTPITDYSLPPYDNKKRCKITFHTTRISTRPGNTPITDYSLPPYDNKKRCKITFHSTHILTRPGNTPITDYSLPPYDNKKRCKITFHTTHISTRPGAILRNFQKVFFVAYFISDI